MSGTATIVTYGGIDVLEPLFTSIARLFGTSIYSNLLKFFTLVGFIWVLTESISKQQIALNIRWLIGFFFIYTILFLPRMTVGIEDRITGQQAVVDKVPLGLAVFASVSSQLGDAVTQLMEMQFSQPDDLKYSKNGMLMASRLVQASTRMSLHDAKFDADLKGFVSQCVFYDLLLDKYTLQDLYEAENLWGFAAEHASPARAFKYHNKIVTCFDGAASLQSDWQAQIDKTSTIYGLKLFGKQSFDSKAKLMQLLPVSYQYLTSLSTSASDIMRQNLLSNAIDDAVLQQGAIVNSDAAVDSYAFARAELMKRSAYQVTGRLAAHWLPIMKNVYEALFYGSFVLIMLLLVLPVGIGILRSYVFSLFWLQSWAPLYAILNLVMNVYARHQSLLVAGTTKGQSLSLYTQPGLFNVNADAVALAGYLSMSIPFIAYGLVKGGASVMTQLATHIGNVGQSVATRAAEEATTGNFGFGNTQFANHSAFNTSAYHHNTSPQYMTGQSSNTLADGATAYHNPDGSHVIDSRMALSNTATSLQTGEAFRASISEQAESATSLAMNKLNAESAATSASLQAIHELAGSEGSIHSHDTTTGFSNSVSSQDSVQNISQSVDRFAHNNNLTTSQATRILADASIGTRAEVGGIFKATASAHVDIQGLSSAERSQIWQNAQEFVQTSNFSENYDKTARALHDEHGRIGNDETHRLIDNVSGRYDAAINYRNEATVQLSRVNSLRSLGSLSSEEMINISSNYSQEFTNWLSTQSGQSGLPLGFNNAEYIQNHQPEVAAQYAKQFTQGKVETLLSQQQNVSSSQLEEKYQNYNEQATSGSMSKINQTYDGYKSAIDKQYESFNLNQAESGLKEKTDEIFKQTTEKVDSNHVADQAQRLKSHAEHRSDPNRRDTATLARKEASQALKSLSDFKHHKHHD